MAIGMDLKNTFLLFSFFRIAILFLSTKSNLKKLEFFFVNLVLTT
jgi:hypothetical protein